MKFQASELPVGKLQARRKTSKLAPLVALTILLTIPLYYPTIRDSSKKLYETETSPAYESLNQEESIRPNSHLETDTSKEDTNKPCSVDDSSQCSDDEKNSGGGDTVEHHNDEEDKSSGVDGEKSGGDGDTMEHHQADDKSSGGREETAVRHRPARKKHEKGRRKRSRRQQADSAVARRDSSAQENRNDPISSKDSFPEENRKQQISRSNNDRKMIRSRLLDDDQCDLFTGEWVPNPDGPYYTNETCNAIQEHQNCMKFGRPDREFLQWRWKPDDCELPIFDPDQFLELVRGKSIAFVGDSVARNHMQSLICLLSRVAVPVDLSGPLDQNKRYEYREYDFNISMFWAPYLVKTEKTDPDDEKKPFKLYLDEFDEHWTTKIALFDYVIISAGHWFFRPTYFYLNNRLIGCLYCPESNVNHLTSYFSYRRAFRTAFRAINDANFNGVIFLRTYAPSHFEGAPWDKGGDCVRRRPYKRNEIVLEDYSLEMYLIQLEELRIAQRTGRRNGGKFRLFDATRAMLLRPDGHPSKYGHWPVANQTFANDCVHWCLPGPIDSWNDFLQELLKRDIGESR